MLDIKLVNEFSTVARDARHKATYLRRKPLDHGERNYEQLQSSSEILEEVAQKIETLLAKYFIHYQLFNIQTMQFDNKELQEKVTRQVKLACRNEIKRKNATVCR